MALPSPSRLMASPQGVAWREVKYRGLNSALVGAVGPEVVVDHVQEHREAGTVSRVDQAAEVVGTAVAAGRSKRRDAVVSPVAAAREIGDGHQLDSRDSEVADVGETLRDRRERPLPREGPDVELVDHEPLEGRPGPRGVRPRERPGVDHLRRPVDALRLEAGGGIRERRRPHRGGTDSASPARRRERRP